MRTVRMILMLFAVLAGSMTQSSRAQGQSSFFCVGPSGAPDEIEVDPNGGRWESTAEFPHVLPAPGLQHWSTLVFQGFDGFDATKLTNVVLTTDSKVGEPGYNYRSVDINGDGLPDLLVDVNLPDSLDPLAKQISLTATGSDGDCAGTAPIQFGSRTVRETIQLSISDRSLDAPYCPDGTATCTIGVNDAEVRLYPYSGAATPQSQLALKFSSGTHTSLCRTQYVKGTNKTDDFGQCYAGFSTIQKYEQILRWVEPRSQTAIYSQKTFTPDQHNTDKMDKTGTLFEVRDNITISIDGNGGVTVQGTKAQLVFPWQQDPYNHE